MQLISIKTTGQISLLAFIAMFVAACNTTPAKKAEPTQVSQAVMPARIEIQEAVGFTIVEESFIDDAVRLDYDRALDLLEQERYAEGIELLKTVATAAPNVSAPRIDLGIAFHRNGDLEAAEIQLKEALAINPSHPVALNELGIVYRKTARFPEARQSYQAALNVYPGFHYARRNLAVLCDLYLADLDCAVSNYEAYMATIDSDDEAEMWLKNARFRSGQVE